MLMLSMRNFLAYLARLKSSLSFLRWNSRLFLTFPLVALAVGALGWSLLASHIEQEKRRAEHMALEEAGTLARGYADHLTRTVQFIDQLLLHVKYEWKLTNGNLQLEHVKDLGLFPNTSQINVFILDRHGNAVTNTLPNVKYINAQDRQYFRVQKNAPGDSLYIGAPIHSRATGYNIIPFSRKLTDSNGDFDGVVVGAVQAAHLTSSYDQITLGKFGFLGVIGGEGVTRATRIGSQVQSGDALGLTALPGFDAAAGSIFMSGRSTFFDQRNRYVGWAAADQFPLIALVGLDQEETLAAYRLQADTLRSEAIAATVALAIGTLIGMAFSARLAWRKHQLEATRATYRMATEGGNEGFYIARALTDARGMTTDFEVLDSNQRGAEFINRRHEDLVGKKISSFFPDTTQVMSILREALRMGSYEGEVEIPDFSPIAAKWVHVKILRSGNDLAIALRDISDTKAHVEELKRRSNEDTLTGLPNRNWVQGYLPQAITHAQENNTLLALLFIDLDGFKAVNDRMGHAGGDELLRNAAARLKDAVRPHDHVVRLGGDEFVVVIERVLHKEDAAHVANRIRYAFQDKFRLAQGEHAIGASIGISVFPEDGVDADTLLRHADVAMYSVKASGKGNYHFYDQKFYDALRVKLEQESELRQAIEHDQFVVYYQPRIDVSSGDTCSMEALVRWKHPRKGLINPLEFIPLAEETGLILHIGEIVIDKVCAQIAQWRRHEQHLVPISINVSPRQFNEVDVPRLLATSIARHDIDPALVEIELTESLMMADSPTVSSNLTAIRSMGIKLLVDDFGTGYSSLSQLQKLDFDVLKVDRAFTAEIERSEKGNVFYKAIITMAHALGMRVVAEGVENERQMNMLVKLECDEIQGFYISEPLPATQAQPLFYKKKVSVS
jgi:diguanylate cyclase (GGDEF)-like protein